MKIGYRTYYYPTHNGYMAIVPCLDIRVDGETLDEVKTKVREEFKGHVDNNRINNCMKHYTDVKEEKLYLVADILGITFVDDNNKNF